MELGVQLKSFPGSGPVCQIGTEGLGLGKLLGSLGFWGHTKLPMTRGKEPKPKERGVEGIGLTSAPSQKKQRSGEAPVPAGSLHVHVCV